MDIPLIGEIMVGIKRQRPGYRFSTVDYDHFQVICVQSGQLACDLGDGVRRLGPSNVVLLVPGTAFDLWCDQGGYRGVGINLVGWPELPKRSIVLPAEAALRQLIALVERELTLAEPGSDTAVRHLSLGLCALALRGGKQVLQATPVDENAYWSERVRQAIDNHLGSDLPVSAVLDNLGLGYRQLTRHFFTEVGMAPKQYQLLRRIEEAQRLLEQTALPITTVAMELGFPSSQHFATQFKRITGRTPSDFRQASNPALA